MRKYVYLIGLLTFLIFSEINSVAQCPVNNIDNTIAAPNVETLNVNSAFVRGTAPGESAGTTIILCVRGTPNKAVVKVQEDGSFIANANLLRPPGGVFTGGEQVIAQVKRDTAYGNPSEAYTVFALCPATLPTTTFPQPVAEVKTATDLKRTVSGRVDVNATTSALTNNAAQISFALCVGNLVKSTTNMRINGTYEFSDVVIPIPANQTVNLKVLMGVTNPGGSLQFVNQSKTVVLSNKDADEVAGWRYNLIGGAEWSGYSSLAQNSNAFVQFYLEGNEHAYYPKRLLIPGRVSGWGRVRLLSGPQPSTNNIGSVFKDPTGTITNFDFTKVGQSFDIVGGASKFLTGYSSTFGRLAWITAIGSTSPLSSQSIAYSFNVPPKNSLECKELIGRGYANLQESTKNDKCLANYAGQDVNFLSFTHPDRSNFYFKWGSGIRLTGTQQCTESMSKCSDGMALLDVTIGQDESITGGRLVGLVAKADGQFPIKTGSASYLYMFGSVYTRMRRNVDYTPLILAPADKIPATPSTEVAVLPLTQPDRDFYRLGVGLNLNQIFCKMFDAGCKN